MTKLAPPASGTRMSPGETRDAHSDDDGQTTRADYRVLVVDDNPSIHDDVKRILGSQFHAHAALDDLASSMLLDTARTPPRTRFNIDSCYAGDSALDRVMAANREDAPYALVFMDIRMPPGITGLEAATQLFEYDEFVHVILCTAYADYEWRKRLEGLSESDRVLILKKPFDPLEVKQLANAMCAKWKLARRDKQLLADLEQVVSDKTRALERANRHLKKEIAERTLAERDLQKAQRLEGLGRLAAGLCHEINNPLSFVMSSIEVIEDALSNLERNIPNDEFLDLQELLRTATIGADRITQIVRSVKLFARQNDAPAELVDVHEVIESAVEMVKRNFGDHIEFIEDLKPIPRVLGRALELGQVVSNLMENAAQALSEQDNRPAHIRVSARAENNEQVIIEVEDTGPGIDDSVIDKIFDPFFTTKPVNKGTGLGLSICHSLIHGMNGTIDVTTKSGEGTTFTIKLPAVPKDRTPAFEPEFAPDAALGATTHAAPGATTHAAPGATTHATTHATPGATPGATHESATGAAHASAEEGPIRGRVLILDDEPFIRRILQRILRAHDVITVSNAHEALSQCLSNTFDVILSDIMMPGMSGQDFYHMLAQARPGEEQKIVFITGGTLIEEVLEFLDSVPNTCVEKPVDAALLNELIESRVAVHDDANASS